MLNNTLFNRAFAVLLLILAGQATHAEEIRDYYAEPGLNPFKETIRDLNETIDVFSGTLQHRYVDLKVPGNGGMDITLTRTYTSQQDFAIGNYRGYTGLGWTMHMGRIVVPTAHKDKICTQPQWNISTKDNPSIEFADGGRELLVLEGDGSGATLITKTNWKADCQGVASGMRVTSPSGVVYYMDVAEYSRENYSWFTSRIEDLNGNSIDISYATDAGGTKYIDAITSSDGRSVTFDYQGLGTTSIRLWKVTSNGQTVEYHYTPAAGGPAGSQHLTKVTRPDGLTWEYTYLPDQGITGAGSYSMESVTYPHGGKITYTYQKVQFDPTDSLGTTSVATKQTSGPGITNGTWNYVFIPASAAGVLDETQVYGPDSITVYYHQGYVTGGSLVWPTGLLSQKIIYDLQGNPLEAVTNTWTSRVISQENYWHGRTKLDNDTAAPVLAASQHWRDGAAVDTLYSLHDAYGNPGRIEETCSLVDCPSRVTTKTYLNDRTQWLIGLPLVDTIDTVGSITRTYFPSGLLKSVDEYGVPTSYTYTAAGDVASVTNARGFTSTYSNYFRGTAQSETSQVSPTQTISVTRVVNPTGTIASITDGRGITRSFTYDSMNRLATIDFPLNADVAISYGKGTQALTRGDYQEVSALNGFGRTVQLDRKDTSVGGETITVTTRYDALGRTAFRSYPNATLGTSTEYDAIGRVTKRTHGDGTFSTTEYGSFLDLSGTVYLGEIRHTDENGNVTYRLYQKMGTFDQNVGLINLISDLSETSVVRSVLGEPLTVYHGKPENDGTISQAVTRTYAYDSRRFLVTETHPETGTTTFGRDEVGNKVSSQVGASGITTYTYDGLNRLTGIDYPAGTVDQTLTYDDNSNLTSTTRGDIVWDYTYDDNNNLTGEDLRIGGADNQVFTLAHGYDALDHMAQTVYPNAVTVDYLPDAFGRPTKAGAYASAASYHPVGVLASVTYGNGVVTTQSLDDLQRLTRIAATAGMPGDITDLEFVYDGNSNVRQVFDYHTPANNLLLDYDANDRLISAGGPWGNASFTYSPHGDILSKTEGSLTLAYGYGSSRRLVQLNNTSNPSITNRTSYQYDAYGNVALRSRILSSSLGGIISVTDMNFRYDDTGSLLEADNPDTTAVERRYRYDGNNMRVSTEKDGLKRYSVYGQSGHLLFERDQAMCEDSAYVFLGRLLAAKDVQASPGCGSGDITPPVVTPPADILAEATGPTTTVALGAASALDDVDGAITPTPNTTGPFAVGVHTITWTATDTAGNVGTATQVVTVQDTTAPAVSPPADLTVEATAVNTPVILGTATATDLVDGTLSPTPDTTGPFALGGHTVTWSATDASGNVGAAVQAVTVQDTTPPSLTAPADVTVPGSGPTAVDIGTATATDIFTPLNVTNDAPSLFPVGSTVVTWQATDANGNTSTATQTITVVSGAPLALSVSRDLPSPQLEGTVYKLTADASGGSGTYEYRFEVKGPATSDVYQVVQDYGPTATLAWNTTGFVGDNVFRISVREAGTANTPVRKWIRAGVNAVGAANDLSVTRNLPSPQIEGTVYQLVADAAGGSGPYEYQFEVKGPATGDAYVVVQPFGANATLDWNTTGYVGLNVFRVSARSAGSVDVPVRRWIRAEVNPVGAAAGLDLTRSLPTPQVEGAVYDIVAAATGGSGSYDYQFELKGPSTGDVYQVVQAFGPASTFSWDTTGQLGDHVFRVSARNASSTDTPVRKWIRAGVNPADAATSLALTRSLPSPQIEGAVYEVTAVGDGGLGTYEYRFELKGPATGEAYVVLQDYSPADSVAWNSTGYVGQNVFRVSVRNAGSTDVPVLRWVVAGVNPTGAADTLAVTRIQPSPQPEGTTYQLDANASGGSGSYEYRFEVKSISGGSPYQVVQDYSANSQLLWDTTGHVGENVIRISARNAGSDHLPVLRWRRTDVTAP